MKDNTEFDDLGDILATIGDIGIEDAEERKPKDKKDTVGRRTGLAAASVGIATTKTARRTFLDASYRTVTPQELVPRLPGPQESHHLLMDGSFTLGEIIPHMQKLIGQPVEITLATLGLNDETADDLAKMMHQRKVTRLRLAMSAYFYGADKSIAQAIINLLRPMGAQFAVERNHAKIQLYKPATGEDRYVIETSSNLRSCNCLEVVAITNDPTLYDFHDKWLTTFFEKNEVTE